MLNKPEYIDAVRLVCNTCKNWVFVPVFEGEGAAPLVCRFCGGVDGWILQSEETQYRAVDEVPELPIGLILPEPGTLILPGQD